MRRGMIIEILLIGIGVILATMLARNEQHHKERLKALSQISRQLSTLHAAMYNLTAPKSSATADQEAEAQQAD